MARATRRPTRTHKLNPAACGRSGSVKDCAPASRSTSRASTSGARGSVGTDQICAAATSWPVTALDGGARHEPKVSVALHREAEAITHRLDLRDAHGFPSVAAIPQWRHTEAVQDVLAVVTRVGLERVVGPASGRIEQLPRGYGARLAALLSDAPSRLQACAILARDQRLRFWRYSHSHADSPPTRRWTTFRKARAVAEITVSARAFNRRSARYTSRNLWIPAV